MNWILIMTILAQLTVIRDAVAAWGAPVKAQVEVGARISEVFGMFETGEPMGVRVKILFDGEAKRGEHEEAGMVDRNYLIVMQLPKSFAFGADDTVPSNAAQPPYVLIDSLREALRGLAFESAETIAAGTNTTENRPDYKQCGIFSTPTKGFVDGYQFQISIGTQLPAVP